MSAGPVSERPDPSGLDRVIELLEDHRLRRSTGLIEAGDISIHLVFGHALHVTAGDESGREALPNVVARLLSAPADSVQWDPGATAGRGHNLSPSEDLAGRLRTARADASPRAAEPGEPEPVPWEAVLDAICANLERRLHLHARTLVAIMRTADSTPDSIRNRIDLARVTPIRAVSPQAVAQLLREAERMVTDAGG